MEIEGIDLTEKEYWVWILWLTIENYNDSGTCLFFRTQGKEEKDFFTGGSIQTTIPFDDYYYLDDYQDFLIRMTGGMCLLAQLKVNILLTLHLNMFNFVTLHTILCIFRSISYDTVTECKSYSRSNHRSNSKSIL